jgi:ribonuclease P protein component
VLPQAHRMRRASEFATVLRAGRRARRGCVVVHLADDVHPGSAVVGLVVGKAVGGSVVRHQVSRRLRAQMSMRLDRLPEGSGTVIRAMPKAAGASSAAIAADLDAALSKLMPVPA